MALLTKLVIWGEGHMEMWEWRRSRKLGFLRLRAIAPPARRAGLILQPEIVTLLVRTAR